MTTDKIILKRNPGSALDLPMAALAALSVGFVAFAMPDALFTDLVTASGLPSVLPAAQPPLGTTARLGVVIPTAMGAFLAAWLLLRSLNGAAPMRRRTTPPEVEAPPLRLRRADTHPDAPLRHPLLAGLELGEPDAVEEAEDEAGEPIPPDFETEALAEWGEPTEEEAVEDEIVTVPAEPLELEEPTIAQLMQRLELGLSRRQPAAVPPSAARKEPAVVETPPAVDDRLRSALDDLRTMAARSA